MVIQDPGIIVFIMSLFCMYCLLLCSLLLPGQLECCICVCMHTEALVKADHAVVEVGHYMTLQWSLYFKTTHGTKKMWSYIAHGLKIKVI